MESPDIEVLSNLISNNLIKKMPNVNKEKWEELLKDKDSKSFIEILNRVISSNGGTPRKDYSTLKDKKVFKKVLIANRGEIAIRIIRACRELGIVPVVVYTKHDKNSLAVKFADEAYPLDTEQSIDSYLDVKTIIDIAKKAKVNAIHPGYGFLAENAEFAKACHDNKIKFIGPSFEAIKKMGDKVEARKLIEEQGVP